MAESATRRHIAGETARNPGDEFAPNSAGSKIRPNLAQARPDLGDLGNLAPDSRDKKELRPMNVQTFFRNHDCRTDRKPRRGRSPRAEYQLEVCIGVVTLAEVGSDDWSHWGQLGPMLCNIWLNERRLRATIPGRFWSRWLEVEPNLVDAKPKWPMLVECPPNLGTPGPKSAKSRQC